MIGSFAPRGNSALLAVTATASTGAQIKSDPTGASGILVSNVRASAKNAWLAWGDSAVAAVIPTGVGANVANGFCIVAGQAYLLSIPPDAYLSAICAGSDSTSLDITRGEIPK